MSKSGLHPIPPKDPVTGGELYVSELTCEASGVTIRGRFEVPRYSRLDPDQAKFLETFLRCRGMLSGVEKELGLSYPTLRSRLDALLEALDLPPFKEEDAKRPKFSEQRKRILEQLESGEISPEDAKRKLKEGAAR